MLAQDSVLLKKTTSYKKLPEVTDPSLNGQYSDMLRRSRNIGAYKMINPSRLSALWKNTNDTLRAERNRRIAAERKVSASNSSIKQMEDSLTFKMEEVKKSEAMISQISFLGMPVSKTSYNLFMWGAVLLLGIALAIQSFRIGAYKREAKYRTELYDELSSEFQSYKVKANEKEKKLARELQDERNKLDELTGR